jgi:hypothetical protein
MFVYVSDEPFMRSAAQATNPVGKARVGVLTTWKVLDAIGVIMGTLEDFERPMMPAGGSVCSGGVAGVANLTGVPASVVFEVTDERPATRQQPFSSTWSRWSPNHFRKRSRRPR